MTLSHYTLPAHSIPFLSHNTLPIHAILILFHNTLLHIGQTLAYSCFMHTLPSHLLSSSLGRIHTLRTLQAHTRLIVLTHTLQTHTPLPPDASAMSLLGKTASSALVTSLPIVHFATDITFEEDFFADSNFRVLAAFHDLLTPFRATILAGEAIPPGSSRTSPAQADDLTVAVSVPKGRIMARHIKLGVLLRVLLFRCTTLLVRIGIASVSEFGWRLF